MERNPNDGLDAQSGVQSGTTGSGYGASGGNVGQEGFGSSGTTGSGMGTSGGAYGSTGSAGTTTEQGRAQQAKDAVTDKLGAARAKAGELKSSLADKLEAGADKLRQRGQTGSYAGATGSGTTSIASDDRMAKVNDKLAGGLQNTAHWIRETDLESLKNDVEQQVKEHPGRTLLIAAGIGYLLGKAFRR